MPPHHSPGPNGGRLQINDRASLAGVPSILKSGIPREMLLWDMRPKEMICGSGMNCWRQLRDWRTVGVWDKLRAVVLSGLRGAETSDWPREAANSRSIGAGGGGEACCTNPTDRAPLGANTPYVQQLLPVVVAISQVRGKSEHRNLDRVPCTQAALMTLSEPEPFCAGTESCLPLPNVVQNSEVAWENSIGRSNGVFTCCINSADSEFSMNIAMTFILGLLALPSPLYAFNNPRVFVGRSLTFVLIRNPSGPLAP
jgi:hypothetical protein